MRPGLAPPVVATDQSGDAREWRRPAALLGLLLLFSVVRPAVLVGLPFAVLVLALPIRRPIALALATLLALLSLLSFDRTGLWYAERGWAILVGGWFAGLTMRFPRTPFTTRALGAVAGAAAVAGAFFLSRPGAWRVVAWSVGERMRLGVASALEAMHHLKGSEGMLTPGLVAGVYRAAEVQAHLFPSLLGLGSVAGLGVAWWMYVRLGLGIRGALGPLARFRFNDHLIWMFVGGLLMLVLGVGEGWTRTGSNAVTFMGALYALRGGAVVLFVSGGLSLLGAVALGLAFLFLAPVVLVGAMVIGLSDTWLDLRAKASSGVVGPKQ